MTYLNQIYLMILVVFTTSAVNAQKVQPGKIILNGENPFIWLHETEGGPRTSEASIWTITYSEKGAGHILLIKSELTNNDWRIYTDNPELARWMQTTVQGMLNPETKDLSIPITSAEFSRSGDVGTTWRQTVISAEDVIIMEWYDIKKPILVQNDKVSEPGRPYGVSAVMIPCEDAKLTLNGKKAKGKVLPMVLDGHPFNTAALAFSENWRAEKP